MTKSTQDELRSKGRDAFELFGEVGFNLLLLGAVFGAGFMLQWGIYFILAAVAIHKAMTIGADAIDWTRDTALSAVDRLKFWDNSKEESE